MPYLRLPVTAGVYKIFFHDPAVCYIGSTVNLRMRRKGHFTTLRRGSHPNQHLQYAFSKYGEDALHFEIVEHIAQREDLIVREQYYLDTLKPHYNISKTAVNSPRTVPQASRVPWNKGKRLTDEAARARLSDAHIGQSSHMKGKKHAPEALAKMSASLKGLPAWNKGKPWDEVNQQRLRTIGIGRTPHNKGKKLGKPSPRIGKPLSPESRASLTAKNRETWEAKGPEARRQSVEKRRATMAAKKAAKNTLHQASLWDDTTAS